MDLAELDQTQAITFDDVEEQDLIDKIDSDVSKKAVAFLKVLLQPGLRETTYPLYEGDNIVGRSPDSCHIWISSKSLSKEHACIQIINNVHMIFDKKSRNKTRRGKLFLHPEVRYELKDNDEIFFADVKCIYLIENEESRLMLPDPSDVLAANTPEKDKLTAVKTSVAESKSEEEDEKFQETIEETVLSDDDSDPDKSCDQDMYYAATQPYGLQLQGNHDNDTDDDDDDASNVSQKSSQEFKEEKGKTSVDVKSALKASLKKDGQVKEPSDGTTAGDLKISHLDSDVPCHFSISTLACDKTVIEYQTSDSEEAAMNDDPTSHCETVMLTETAQIESSQAKCPQTETNNNKGKSYKLQKRKTEKVETEVVSIVDSNGTLVLEEKLSQMSNEDEVPAKMARSSARRGRQQIPARGQPIKYNDRKSIVKTQNFKTSDSLKPIEKNTTDNSRDLKTCVLVKETQESDKSTDNEEDFDVCEPTQAYTMGYDKPPQTYSSGSDEPTQKYPYVLDEPTQVYPKRFDEPTQVENLEESTQVYPKGCLDEPTQVYPKGFDQEESLDKLLQADPKGFEEPTQAYAKDFDSSSDTAEDKDETQKFFILASNTTDKDENVEDQTEKVNNEALVVENSVSEDDSDLEAESVLKPDLAGLNCEDQEVDDDGCGIRGKTLHLDVTMGYEDNINVSPIIELMKERGHYAQMGVKSPVKGYKSKQVFDATATSPVKSPFKSALASKRGPTSPVPKHVVFAEDTKKDSQLNLGKSSPSNEMSPQRQTSTSVNIEQTKEETSTEDVRNAVENSPVIEEKKLTLQRPDPVNDTPLSSSLERSFTVSKRRGRKPKVKLDSSWDKTVSSDTNSKLAGTGTGESSVHTVGPNQTPEGRLDIVGLTKDKSANSVKVINEGSDDAKIISITTESPSIENSFTVPMRRGRKPKVKLDSTKVETVSNDAKSKQAKTSTGESSIQAETNQTTENRLNNLDESADSVEGEESGGAEKMDVNTTALASSVVEGSSSLENFNLSTTESNVRVSTRRKRVSSHPAYLKDFETATPKASKKETVTPKALKRDSKSKPDLEIATETASPKALKRDSKNKPDLEIATETATSTALKKDSKSKPDLEIATETATPTVLKKDSKSKPDLEIATETATSKALKKDFKSKPDLEIATETVTSTVLKKDSKNKADVKVSTETATPKALKKDSKSKAEKETVDNPKPVQLRGRKSTLRNKTSTVASCQLNTENTSELHHIPRESEDLEDFTNISPPKKAKLQDTPPSTSETTLRQSATLTKNAHKFDESSNATPIKITHGLDKSTSVTLLKNTPNLGESPSANATKKSIDLDQSIFTMSPASFKPEGSVRGQSQRRRPKAQGGDKNLKSGGKTTAGRGQRKNTEQSSQSDTEMSVASSSSSATTASSSKKQTQPPSRSKGDKTISTQSLRRSSLCQKPKVMFTGLVDEPGEKIVKDLGGEIATAIQDCTHLVTDKIRRTVKFLSGLSKGIPIVSPLWLENSKQAGTFLDGHKYLVSDAAIEKQYKFTLSSSITKAASGGGLLKDYKVHVTKSVTPTPDQMQEILLCAGAVYLKTMPKSASENTIVISCLEDKKLCQPAIKAGIPVVEAEFILTGILRQEVDFKLFSLFSEGGQFINKRENKH